MTKVERYPIILSEHGVALLTIFKRTDYIDDMWAWDYLHEEVHSQHKRSAKQFVEAMEGHWCVAFLKALRDEIDIRLEEHRAEMAAMVKSVPQD